MNECEELFGKILPFWDNLNDSDKSLICRYTSHVKFPKGSNVHGGDGECTGAIVLKSGCLRTYILSEGGREVTLYRMYPGDICMLTASCVIRSITFDVIVDAEEDSECIIINGNAYSEIADRNVHVKNFALEIAVSKFSDVMWIMQQILFMSFDKRLAIFLLDEIAKTGGDIVKLTNEQVAKYMGSAREVVSRMLKYFSTEGIAERTHEGIRIIDKAKLRKLAM
jgi:CRP/FNR family transcriptional regulator